MGSPPRLRKSEVRRGQISEFEIWLSHCVVLLGSPLAVANAAATLPGVHIEHDLIQNKNRQEQLKDRTYI